MRLSEAIRLGSMLHPQGFGSYTLMRGDGTYVTCALGAAINAGYSIFDESGKLLLPASLMMASCPVCAFDRRTILSVVAHLNDGHRWTRERIADWVEEQERQHGATKAKVVVEAVPA